MLRRPSGPSTDNLPSVSLASVQLLNRSSAAVIYGIQFGTAGRTESPNANSAACGSARPGGKDRLMVSGIIGDDHHPPPRMATELAEHEEEPQELPNRAAHAGPAPTVMRACSRPARNPLRPSIPFHFCLIQAQDSVPAPLPFTRWTRHNPAHGTN